MANSETLLLR
ncbi:hypothetical protein YPPY48_2225, partial [Yersinia pestis PY-48]